MCRNIKSLYNFDPPATDQEIRAASLQFVRKLSGFNKPSAVNEKTFNKTIEKISQDVHQLLDSLQTSAPSRDREIEAQKAKERSSKRFNKPS